MSVSVDVQGRVGGGGSFKALQSLSNVAAELLHYRNFKLLLQY